MLIVNDRYILILNDRQHGEDRQEFGWARYQAVDGVLQRRPQVGAAAEEADHEQGVERFDWRALIRSIS
jgi:hypothetical protein